MRGLLLHHHAVGVASADAVDLPMLWRPHEHRRPERAAGGRADVVSPNMSARAALALAVRLGFSVKRAARCPEWLVSHPVHQRPVIRVSSGRKDVPRRLLTALRRALGATASPGRAP